MQKIHLIALSLLLFKGAFCQSPEDPCVLEIQIEGCAGWHCSPDADSGSATCYTNYYCDPSTNKCAYNSTRDDPVNPDTPVNPVSPYPNNPIG